MTDPGGGRRPRRRRMCPPNKPFRPGWRTQDAPEADLSAGKLPRAVFSQRPEVQKVALADKGRPGLPSVRQTCLYSCFEGENY